MAKDIFFSYGHDEHKEFVLKVKDYLESEGFEVFVDSDKLRLGDDYEHKLEKAIEAYDYVVFFITPHSARRPKGYCSNEIAFANSLGKKIYPIVVEYHVPPLSLSRLQYLDMEPFVIGKAGENFFQEKMKILVEVLKNNSVFEDGDVQAKLRKWLSPIDFSEEYRKYSKIVGREWILPRVDKWIADHPDSNLLWLKASPGYGKSAIGTFLANNHKDVIGIHYCNYEFENKNNAANIIKTLVYDFQTQIKGYADEIINYDFNNVSNIFQLFEYLIVNPLHILKDDNRNYIFIIDGVEDILQTDKKFLKLISEKSHSLPSNIKIIIISKDEYEIGEIFAGVNFIRLDDCEENERDCLLYIEKSLKKIEQSKHLNDPMFKISLLSASDKNMHYLERFFHAASENDHFDINNPRSFPEGLGNIYKNYLDNIVTSKDEYRAKFRPILEILVAYVEPIPEVLLARILKIDMIDMLDLIDELKYIINIDDNKIRFSNRPIRDWLLSRDTRTYRISIEAGQNKIDEFLTSIEYDTYHCDYIDFYNLNKKLIAYLMTKNRLDEYFDWIDKCPTDERKISLLSQLSNFFSSVENNYITAKIDEALVKYLEELYAFDNEVWEEDYFRANLGLSISIGKKDDTDKAISILIRTQQLLEDSIRRKGDDDNLKRILSKLKRSLAYQYKQVDEIENAIQLEEEVVGVLRGYEDEDREKWGEELAKALSALAYSYRNYRPSDIGTASLDKIDESCNIWKDLYYRNTKRWSAGYASILRSRAYEYKAINRVNEALEDEERAFKIFKSLYDENNKRWVDKYRKSLVGLNYMYRMMNRVEESIEKGNEALAIVEELYQNDKDRWSREYASTLRNLSESYELNNNIKMSAKYKDKALSLIEDEYGSKHAHKWSDEYIKIIFSYMDLLRLANDIDGCCTLLKKASKVILPKFKHDKKRNKKNYIKYLDKKAFYYGRTQKTVGKAIEIGSKVMMLSQELYEVSGKKEGAEEYCMALGHLANYYSVSGDPRSAHFYELEAKNILFKLYKKDNMRWGDLYTKSLINLSVYEYQEGRHVSALRKQTYSLRILEDLYLNNSKARWIDSYIKGFINLIIYYDKSGKLLEAITIGYEAKDIIEPWFRGNEERWLENYIGVLNNLSIAIRDYNIQESLDLIQESCTLLEKYRKISPVWESKYLEAKETMRHTEEQYAEEKNTHLTNGK